jgi:hypothetical protein
MGNLDGLKNIHMDLRYQVKQYIGRIEGRFCWFDVLATGIPSWVLLRAVQGEDRNGFGGWNTGFEFPVKRKELKYFIKKF